ncbi:MAG TPA: hypothetical protein VHU44_10945 [Acidobacteriaceae bacterium]|jgi:hypothetical protein|nr:hypothetical protein [Acidobacteriaceae bacterium]
MGGGLGIGGLIFGDFFDWGEVFEEVVGGDVFDGVGGRLVSMSPAVMRLRTS